MALFYITGLSGTGKSAVLTELRARGYHARGVDEDGYGDWISRAAGTPADFPCDDSDFDFHAWYREHEWVLSMRRIGILSRAAARLGEPVFLCGVASGDGTVWHLFDKVLALVADVPTLKRRIAARPNEFGKIPEEFAIIVRLHASFEAAYRGFGAVVIDATQPVATVVDQILAASVRPPSTSTRQPQRPAPLVGSGVAPAVLVTSEDIAAAPMDTLEGVCGRARRRLLRRLELQLGLLPGKPAPAVRHRRRQAVRGRPLAIRGLGVCPALAVVTKVRDFVRENAPELGIVDDPRLA